MQSNVKHASTSYNIATQKFFHSHSYIGLLISKNQWMYNPVTGSDWLVEESQQEEVMCYLKTPHSLQIQHQPVTVHHQLVEQYAKSLYPNSSVPSYDPSKHRLLQIKKHVIRLNSHYSHLTVTATATTIDIIITPQSLHIFVTSHNNLCSPYTVSNFCRDEKFFNALYH